MTGEGFKTFGEILNKIDRFVWGVPLIVLIILTGIYLTIRVRGLQVRHLGKALKFMVKNEEGGEGELRVSVLCVRHFRRLSEQVILSVLQLLLRQAARCVVLDDCSGIFRNGYKSIPRVSWLLSIVL